MDEVQLTDGTKDPAHYGYDQPESQPSQLPSQPPPYTQLDIQIPPQPNRQPGIPLQQARTQPQQECTQPAIQNTNVVVTQPSATTIIAPPVRPRDYIVVSICVLLCCNLAFGIIAVVFSIMSISDSDAGNYEAGGRNGKVALGINVAGIVVSAVAITLLAALVWSKMGTYDKTYSVTGVS